MLKFTLRHVIHLLSVFFDAVWMTSYDKLSDPDFSNKYDDRGRSFIATTALTDLRLYGMYWSSSFTPDLHNQSLLFRLGSARLGQAYRASGLSVRCLKDLYPLMHLTLPTLPLHDPQGGVGRNPAKGGQRTSMVKFQ